MSQGTKNVIYWAATILISLAFFVTGFGNLIPMEHIAHDMLLLGYPGYFRIILGTWKILGAIIIILPRARLLKEWAYAGILFDLSGASLSRLASGADIMTIILPILIAFIAILSLAFRPEDRKLGLKSTI